MTNKPTLHFIDGSSRNRAELARTGFALGYHCEVYADLQELTGHLPRDGIIMARDCESEGGIAQTSKQLQRLGVWLPMIAFDDAPRPSRIVAAIRAGAFDYLALPLDHDKFAATLERIEKEARVQVELRRRKIKARSLIANLSRREREVLDWLAEGCSNKTIAHQLQISPRTVEIHRANMMTKLGARHAAEAVRLKLEAQMDAARQDNHRT